MAANPPTNSKQQDYKENERRVCTEITLMDKGGGSMHFLKTIRLTVYSKVFTPKLYWSQTASNISAIVFEECGPDLNTIFQKMNKKFSGATVAYIALSAV